MFTDRKAPLSLSSHYNLETFAIFGGNRLLPLILFSDTLWQWTKHARITRIQTQVKFELQSSAISTTIIHIFVSMYKECGDIAWELRQNTILHIKHENYE